MRIDIGSPIVGILILCREIGLARAYYLSVGEAVASAPARLHQSTSGRHASYLDDFWYARGSIIGATYYGGAPRPVLPYRRYYFVDRLVLFTPAPAFAVDALCRVACCTTSYGIDCRDGQRNASIFAVAASPAPLSPRPNVRRRRRKLASAMRSPGGHAGRVDADK